MKITDKMRLDWLGRQRRAYGNYFGKGLIFLAHFPKESRALRTAIDAAIRAEKSSVKSKGVGE